MLRVGVANGASSHQCSECARARLCSAAQLKKRLGSAYSLRTITEWIKHQSTQQHFQQRHTPKPFFPLCIGGSDAHPFGRAQSVAALVERLGYAIGRMTSDNEPLFVGHIYRAEA